MKLTRAEFIAQPEKAITLIGMSGVGKSYLSGKLESWGWFHYSCDDLIGSKYLGAQDMEELANFVGQIGSGVGLETFGAKQQQYYDAECAVLRDMGVALEAAGGQNFVNDSSGSLCEIDDESLLKRLGNQTLFVYIKAEPEEEKEILERAQIYPKPLFFPPAKFNDWLRVYMKERSLMAAEDIVPDDFMRWVFPRLFESRLPKYQRLADLYGTTLPSARIRDIESAEQFIEIVAGSLDE